MADGEGIDHVTRLLNLGARGYIPTSMSFAIAVQALHLVHAGGVFVPANSVLSCRQRADEPRLTPLAAPGAFTARQVAVIEGLRKGKANKIIAYELKMRESTVKVHVRNIMKKLNAKNRTEVAYLTNDLIGMAPR